MLALSACRETPPPPTSTSTALETITGHERIGWEQRIDGNAGALGWVMYVDGTRVVLHDVRCSAHSSEGMFSCAGQLPPMASGLHTLQITSYRLSDPAVESTKSGVLRVTVTAATQGLE